MGRRKIDKRSKEWADAQFAKLGMDGVSVSYKRKIRHRLMLNGHIQPKPRDGAYTVGDSEFARMCAEAVGNVPVLSFCAGNDVDAVTLRGWINGKHRPPTTRIKFAAELIGASEKEVAMAVYGVESQEDAIMLVKNRARARANARAKEKYHRNAHLRPKKERPPLKTPEEKYAKRLEHSHRRRHRVMMASGGGLERTRWYDIMKDWGYRCAYCGSERAYRGKGRLSLEHVVPVPVGPHDETNIIPACLSCNSSKQNRDLLEWASFKGIALSDRVMAVYHSVMAEVTNA